MVNSSTHDFSDENFLSKVINPRSPVYEPEDIDSSDVEDDD